MTKKDQFFGYLLAIFGIGVLIGMLYAPRKGSESRDMLVDKMKDYCRQTREFINSKAKELKDEIDDIA